MAFAAAGAGRITQKKSNNSNVTEPEVASPRLTNEERYENIFHEYKEKDTTNIAEIPVEKLLVSSSDLNLSKNVKFRVYGL